MSQASTRLARTVEILASPQAQRDAARKTLGGDSSPDLFTVHRSEPQAGLRAKKAGQADALSGLPAAVRLSVGTCVRMVARRKVPFCSVPNNEGYPNVLDDLPPMTRECLAAHPSSLGPIFTALAGNGFLQSLGYATASAKDAHNRPVKIWILGENAK